MDWSNSCIRNLKIHGLIIILIDRNYTRMKNIDNYLDDFERALLNLDHQTAYEIVKQARVNSSPMVLANELITLSLERIGQGWELGPFFAFAGLYGRLHL